VSIKAAAPAWSPLVVFMTSSFLVAENAGGSVGARRNRRRAQPGLFPCQPVQDGVTLAGLLGGARAVGRGLIPSSFPVVAATARFFALPPGVEPAAVEVSWPVLHKQAVHLEVPASQLSARPQGKPDA